MSVKYFSKVLFFLFLYGQAVFTFAQKNAFETGIKFLHEDWNAAMEQAQREQKLIFMDAYTTWCGPCKKMNRETFPDSAVGAFFNKHFVSLKMDMEKGDGERLASTYGIMAFPTLLFIDPQGAAVHRAVGYQNATELLAVGRVALDNTARISSYDQKFQEGNREPDFLKAYSLKLADAYDPRANAIAEIYLATQPEWTRRDLLEYIYRFGQNADSRLFRYIVAQQPRFDSLYGKEVITLRIQDLLVEKLYNEKNLPSLAHADSLMELVYRDKKIAKRKKANYRMQHSRMSGDRPAYTEAAIQYFRKFDDHAEELGETAQTFVEQIDDTDALSKAAKWAKRAVKLDPSMLFYRVTLATLYEKLGKLDRAIDVTNEAIKIGKTRGEATPEADSLLLRLQNAKKDGTVQ